MRKSIDHHAKRRPGESDAAWLARIQKLHEKTRMPPMVLIEPPEYEPGTGPYDPDDPDE
jgi:hypothetical protein